MGTTTTTTTLTLRHSTKNEDRLDYTYLSVTHYFVNKSVTKYIFPYSSFNAEHDGHNYFHVKQLLRKLEGLLQRHVSLFIPPPSPVLSQYIPFYEVRRKIKTQQGIKRDTCGCKSPSPM